MLRELDERSNQSRPCSEILPKAIEACEELRIMKQKGGLNKFSSTSEYGDLPSIDQIKSFWSRYK